MSGKDDGTQSRCSPPRSPSSNIGTGRTISDQRALGHHNQSEFPSGSLSPHTPTTAPLSAAAATLQTAPNSSSIPPTTTTTTAPGGPSPSRTITATNTTSSSSRHHQLLPRPNQKQTAAISAAPTINRQFSESQTENQSKTRRTGANKNNKKTQRRSSTSATASTNTNTTTTTNTGTPPANSSSSSSSSTIHSPRPPPPANTNSPHPPIPPQPPYYYHPQVVSYPHPSHPQLSPGMNPGYPPPNGYAHHPSANPYQHHSTPSPHAGVPHPHPPASPYSYYPTQHYPQQYHPHPHPHTHPHAHQQQQQHPSYHPNSYYPVPVPGYSPSPTATQPPPIPPPLSTESDASVSATSSAAAAAASKRKRKEDSGKGKTSGASDAEESTPDTHKKRTKTQRACDSCRSRKIRCDIMVDADPPICHHCKQYGFECTFFLPITETRFKKKRLEEEAAAAAAAAAVQAEKEKVERDRERESSAQRSPMPDSVRNVRVDGPTSMTHLLHSTATVPPRAYHSYDQRYHHTWEVSETGDGLVQVSEPTLEDSSASLTKTIDLHVERDVIEKLINSYFTDIAPLVPIVTQAEFLANPSPPPILLYSICLVAACKRDVPQAVFDSLRIAVNDVIKSEDVLCTASIVNVQSLLILCQCADCHSPYVPNALSALWIRLGTAIRMAQDLGLHRAEAVKTDIETRRRVWGACVITDRWTSLTYGHPYMIDVEDCDARLPSSGDPNDLYTAELLRLSLILGRVLKTIYGPSGLTYATDDKLFKLLDDMKNWRKSLPESLQFRGLETPRSGGILFILYASVSMIFWRVFMRISYSCPEHLKFNLSIDQWSELVQMTGDAIDWLDANETLYDVWMLVAYAATSCALVQYHTWARRKDSNAQARLKKLRDCVRRWESCLQPEHMSSRRKTAEIITLLYETTLGPLPFDHRPSLNPTTGVIGKPQGNIRGLKYRPDPTRPGGGVFVAHGKSKREDFRDLPAGTVVLSQGVSDEENEAASKASVANSNNLNNSSSGGNNNNDNGNNNGGGDNNVNNGLNGNNGGNGKGNNNNNVVGNGNDTKGNLAGNNNNNNGLVPVPPHGMNSGAGLGAGFLPPGASSLGLLPDLTSLSSNVNPTLNLLALGAAGINVNGAGVGGGRGVTGAGAGAGETGPAGQGAMGAGGLMNDVNVVRILNVLDPNPQPTMVEQMQAVDTSMLEGIPGSLFDWPQWENFFARMTAPADPNNSLGPFGMVQQQGQQQHQHQHQHQHQQQQQQQEHFLS